MTGGRPAWASNLLLRRPTRGALAARLCITTLVSARLNLRTLLATLFASGAVALAGCSTTADIHPAQRARLEAPQQPTDSIRLFIYRPQTLVGMW